MVRQERFLDQVAAFLSDRDRAVLDDAVMIVPNYQMGQRLVCQLGRRQGKPAWAPHLYTLSDLVQHLSPLHVPDNMTLLSELYKSACEMKATDEIFEDFLAWGPKVLADFNTADHCLAPIDKLFAMPIDQALMHTVPKAVRTLWASIPEASSEVEGRWASLWKRLPTLYTAFTQRLQSRSMGYEGLQRRTLCRALQRGGVDMAHPYIAVVGLHRLTLAEERIFALVKEKTRVDFYWDQDPHYCEDVPDHPAGHYFRRRRHDPLFAQALPKSLASKMQASPPKVKVVGAQGLHGQLEALRQAMDILMTTEGKAKVEGDAVIVLPDPKLLIPLLHALPASWGNVKVSGGYPLTETPAYALLVALLRFHVAWQEAQGVVTDPLLEALQVLSSHPYLGCSLASQHALMEVVRKDPRNLPSAAEGLGVIGLCLQPLGDDVLTRVMTCLEAVQSVFKADHERQTWEKVALHTCKEVWKRIAAAWPRRHPTQATHALLQILKIQAEGVTLPLHNGDKDQGIAIMSLSQTLGLDFAYVFVLGMNEGVMPTPPSYSSFVPHMVQQAFGWPTPQAEEALTAYPWYRLLQRARHVFCTYEKGGSVGERSRYLYAIPHTLGWNVEEGSSAPALLLPSYQRASVAKSAAVMEKLEAFMVDKQGKALRTLTPSALNTYLDCPCCFYLQYVARIRPTKPLTAEMDAPTFGKLFHAVMEQLYRPYVGTVIHPTLFNALIHDPHKAIQAVCARVCLEAGDVHGMHLVVEKVLTKLASQVGRLDQAHAPFTLLGLEQSYDANPLPFALSNGKKVALGGIIDRMDRKGDTIRVLDYKTGTFSPKIPSIASLFDPSDPGRNKAALQLLWYAWLYDKKHVQDDTMRVMPGIVSTRTAWKSHQDVGFVISEENARTHVPLQDVRPHTLAWEAKLRDVLDTLFDPTIPFAQTERSQHAPYGICQAIFHGSQA